MSEPLDKLEKKIDILLSADRVIVILDLCGTERFMNVKISSPEEIFGRHKDSLKNSYMVFRDDVNLVWKEAKQTKKFRKFPGSFKNISLLWSSLPENIKNIYMQIFTDYKKLAPRLKNYINNGERLIQPEEIQRAPSDNVKTIEEKMGKTIGVGAGNNENLFLQRPAFLEGNGCSSYMVPYFDNQMVDQEAFLHNHMNMDKQQQLVEMAPYFDNPMGHDLFYEVEKENEE